ncbi:MAG: DUF2079 domain-containing protein [Eubacteriales bacterium]|nr:DUF2079 domain-containing protein [Eubacteriales bacterium]
MFVQRLISSWCLTALAILLYTKGDFTLKTYAGIIHILIVAGITAGIFIILTVIDKAVKKTGLRERHSDDYALAAALLLYAFVLVYRLNDFYFYIGVMSVLTIAWVYFQNNDRLGLSYIKIPLWSAAVITGLAAVGCAVFIGVLTSLRYLTFSTPNFDFGIFVNMFHNMSKSFLPYTTCERDKLLSHFAVHLSPIYYLILPFYFLFPYPLTLQIAQAIIVVSAVIPLFLIAKKRGLSPKAIAAICIAFCFYPALSGGCFYDIHENCFLVPLVLWMFYFLDIKKNAGLYICALLTLFVKEDAAVYVAFVALSLIIDGRDFKSGPILMTMSVVYFMGAVYYLNVYGEGIMASRYSNYITKGGGLGDMIINLFRNPALLFAEGFNNEKLIFLLQMLIPIAFTPLITKRISRLTLLLPMVLVNLMPDYKYQHSIYYQYTFGVTAFLFYAAVLNISEMTSALKRAMGTLAVVASVMMFSSTTFDKIYYIEKYNRTTYEIRIMNDCLANIPAEASVQATTFLVPQLAQRALIYEIDSKNATEYLAVDLRYEEDDYIKFLIDIYKGEGYMMFEYHENIIMVMVDPDWDNHNIN